jgi:hypothetical protein
VAQASNFWGRKPPKARPLEAKACGGRRRWPRPPRFGAECPAFRPSRAEKSLVTNRRRAGQGKMVDGNNRTTTASGSSPTHRIRGVELWCPNTERMLDDALLNIKRCRVYPLQTAANMIDSICQVLGVRIYSYSPKTARPSLAPPTRR